MRSIMEEQRTENEYKVESDKQLFYEDLSLLFLSMVPCPTHPSGCSLSRLTLSLSFNYFVVTYFFAQLFFVLSVNAYLCSLRQVCITFCVHCTFTYSINNKLLFS